jgi:hypothetical protein
MSDDSSQSFLFPAVSWGGMQMTLLTAVAIIDGVGFAFALISSIGPWRNAPEPKPGLVDLALPFAVKWVL